MNVCTRCETTKKTRSKGYNRTSVCVLFNGDRFDLGIGVTEKNTQKKSKIE